MIQSNTFPIGFNIHLLSFSLPRECIKNSDEIRVSITTMPEQTKQHFKLHGRKMERSNHVFTLNITNQTKRVIMVFRKKLFFSDDPIIASTIIYSDDFPDFPQNNGNIETSSTNVKTLNIYYPLQKQIREMKKNGEAVFNKHINRKIIGNMQVQLSFTSPYPNINQKKCKKCKDNNKDKVHKEKAQNSDYSKVYSETRFNNCYCNSNSINLDFL